MNKKRIVAIVVLVLIALLYLATLIFAVIDSPFARSCLMASLFCTIVLPVMAYVYLKLIENLKSHKDADEDIEDIKEGKHTKCH